MCSAEVLKLLYSVCSSLHLCRANKFCVCVCVCVCVSSVEGDKSQTFCLQLVLLPTRNKND